MFMYKLLSLILLFSSKASAYDGWSIGSINQIRIQEARMLIVQESADNPAQCSNTDYLYLTQGEQIHYKNMFSALLTAYATKAEVRLALKGCSEGGKNGYPVISQVWIQ